MSKGKLLSQQLKKSLANEKLADIKQHLKAGANVLDRNILAMRIKNEEIINILVPYLAEEYKEKQTKYKINAKNYQNSVSRLLKLGYSIQEANKIIFQKKYLSIIKVINQSHLKLITLGYQHKDIVRITSHGANFQSVIKSLLNSFEVTKLGFSPEEVIKVVAEVIKVVTNDGSSKNLTVLTQHKNALCALSFSREELIKLVVNDGGSKNLAALIQHENALLALGFSREELIKVVAYSSGSKNFAALTRYENLLCEVDFSRKELIKIVAHHGGSNNLQVLMNYVNRLKQDDTVIKKQPLTYEIRDALVKIVAHKGGSKNLAALIQHENSLRAIGFSREELIKIVAHHGGFNNLQVLMNYVNRLKQDDTVINKQPLTYEMRDALVKIVAHKGGSKNLAALIQHENSLHAIGFSREELIKIVARGGGSKNLAALIQHENSLRAIGFSLKELVKIVMHKGGSKSLTALIQHEMSLYKLGFSHEQLTKVVAHDGGANNLQALINYVDHLKEDDSELLTIEQRETLVKILANDGGSKNLAALTQYENLLCEAGFSREELIKIVAHHGGSNNLQVLMNYVNRLKQDDTVINKQPLTYEMRDALVKIVAHKGGSKNLAALIQHENSLHAIGFSREELIKIVARGGGSKNLAALIQHENSLRAIGFSLKELVKIVSQHGGSNNLRALINYVNDLKKQDITQISKPLTYEMRDALIKILAHHGGSKNLIVLSQYEKILDTVGFSREEFIKIVGHSGGSKNLRLLKQHETALRMLGFSREDLIKAVAYPCGYKKLVALLKNKPTMEKLGLVKDKIIYSLLQMLKRKGGHQRLKFFLDYYLFFYHCDAIKELLVFCSFRDYLSTERLSTILALNALVYYLKETTNNDKLNLVSWNSSRFPDEISLLDTILKIVNKKLKGDICPLKLQSNNNNYRIISQTSCSVILTQIEKRLTQYFLNDKIQLHELLHVRNADCYRLLQNPEGNKQVYWLDVRPWKLVFPDQNLQTTLIKLFKKGVKDSDILLEENESSSQHLSIFRVGEYTLSIPVSVIETIVNDYPHLHRCQLIFSQHVPSDEETKLGFLYLYKTDKTLECIVKNDEKLDNLVINRSSLTPKQNDEISEALASTGLKVQLHQSTLRALSRLILDTGKNYYLSDDSGEIIEFIDRPDNFFSPRENKLVTVTKINKSSLPDNVITPTLQTSPSKITASVNDNNELNKEQYLSMPIIETSPIRATLPNKPYKVVFDILGETEKKSVADTEFIKPENKRLYEVKRKLTPLPSFKHKKLKKNEIIELNNQSVPEINTFPRRGIYLGEGTYNRVYRFGPIVQKTRKNTALEMDEAKRAVRVFNEINKELNSEPGRANVINENTWELPYIDGYVPSIEKLSNTILEIYVKTERVLIDGYCKDNILKEKQSGKLYCIDPGLAVRRNSVLSKSYWYNPNTFVKANREVHYKYMVELIGKYKESKKPDKSLPIFCIFGIDFYDQNLVVNYGRIRDFCHESFLVLGIAVYFSILLKIKLNAEACIRLLRQEIKIDLDTLKKSYAEEDINKSQAILKPLFFFNPIAVNQKRKATGELQWGLTMFQSKGKKAKDETLSHAVILKLGSKLR